MCVCLTCHKIQEQEEEKVRIRYETRQNERKEREQESVQCKTWDCTRARIVV